MSDNRYSRNTVDQFGYKTLSASDPQVKKIKDGLKRNGQKVESVEVGKQTRPDGIPRKPLRFNLESGQTITLTVVNDGAVIAVLLNKLEKPAEHMADFSKLPKELADLAKANEPAFIKRQKAAFKQVKVVSPDGKKKGSASLKKQLEEWQTTLSQVTANHETLQATLAERQQTLQTGKQALVTNTTALKEAQARESELNAEIAKLEAA